MRAWRSMAWSPGRQGDPRPRLLVVEDDPDIRDLLRLVFAGDWTVRCTGSMEEAREALARAPLPDVALVDLLLPDGDGADLCREAKQAFPSLRVAVLTAYVQAQVEAEAAGADLVLMKPFDPDDLHAAVARLIPDDVRVARRAQASEA